MSSWNTDSSRLNSTYLRIAKQVGIASNPLRWCPITQESLCKWAKSAREASVICTQAAGFNRCLFKVQQNMQTQHKWIWTGSKDKSASKGTTATDKLQYLMDFNANVCQAIAKSVENFLPKGQWKIILCKNKKFKFLAAILDCSGK